MIGLNSYLKYKSLWGLGLLLVLCSQLGTIRTRLGLDMIETASESDSSEATTEAATKAGAVTDDAEVRLPAHRAAIGDQKDIHDVVDLKDHQYLEVAIRLFRDENWDVEDLEELSEEEREQLKKAYLKCNKVVLKKMKKPVFKSDYWQLVASSLESVKTKGEDGNFTLEGLDNFRMGFVFEGHLRAGDTSITYELALCEPKTDNTNLWPRRAFYGVEHKVKEVESLTVDKKVKPRHWVLRSTSDGRSFVVISRDQNIILKWGFNKESKTLTARGHYIADEGKDVNPLKSDEQSTWYPVETGAAVRLYTMEHHITLTSAKKEDFAKQTLQKVKRELRGEAAKVTRRATRRADSA